MDFDLSDELIAVRDLAREFAEKEIAPTAAKDDKEKNFRGDLVKKMGELGFYGTMIPESLRRQRTGVSRHGADHRRDRAGAQRHARGDQYADRSGVDVAAIRHRRTETEIYSGFGFRRNHRLLRDHRGGCRLGCRGDAHDGDQKRRSTTSSTAARSGFPTVR